MAATRFTLKWVKNVYGGGSAIPQEYDEGTSETFPKAAPVVHDASEDGIVEVPGTAGVPTTAAMLGLALEAASGTAGTVRDVEVPRPGDIYECSLASDQDTMVAPTVDHIGDLVGIIKLSTTGGAGTEYVADTGNTDWAKIIALHPQDIARRGGVSSLVAGDRVLIQFLGAVLDAAGSQA
jgi:hypothetical protein